MILVKKERDMILFSASSAMIKTVAHVTEHRIESTGHPAVKLRLTSDQIH